jgi:colicin import membrane protein
VKETRADTVHAFVAAVVLHALLFALAFFGLWWTRMDAPEPLRGPVIEADLIDPNALSQSVRRALASRPEPAKQAEPEPQQTAPPPQPEPEPRPQEEPTPPQPVAQDFIAEPDKVEQEKATREAVSTKPPAEKEQEAKHRQEQVDLAAKEKQLDAERKKRLTAMEQMRQQQLADIRRQREANQRTITQTERNQQRIQQLANADAPSTASPPPGQGGTSDDLRAQWINAIVQTVRMNWTRPDDVPPGQCPVRVHLERGGGVANVEVLPGCPYDELTKRSVEAAFLKAQPLPYAGFERVFQPELTIGFRAE